MWWIPCIAELEALRGVLEVRYDACMHGGARKKHQLLLTNCPALKALEVFCDGRHPHKKWVPLWRQGRFDGYSTREEAEYPAIFCERYAAAVDGGMQRPAAGPVTAHKKAE